MKLKPLFRGLSTFLPGVNMLPAKGTGGTNSARYCYSVWLRHLVMAKENGLNTCPKIVAELGPGDSIGIGLAALLSGCETYYAFDVVEYANVAINLSIFDELVDLFREKAQIPGDDEYPRVKPKLEDYRFPSNIIDDERLQKSLENSRINKIRSSINNVRDKNSVITYKVPWYESNLIKEESVGMIFSQAVLEHVDDLKNTYNAMYNWLEPNGYMSHTIDFKCHGIDDEWNGHWKYSDFIWKLIRGKRHYFLNREPYTSHLKLIEEVGFKLACNLKTTLESKLTLEQLAPRFRTISQDDLYTCGTFIQAVKKHVTLHST